MIVCFLLNPCIDRTITIQSFVYGGTNRVQHVQHDLSGKGMNVAMVIAALGKKTVCTGFLPELQKNGYFEKMAQAGIDFDGLILQGTARTNIKIFDSSRKMMTELNESGCLGDESAVNALLEKFIFSFAHGGYGADPMVVLSGSLPLTVSMDCYARMISVFNSHGIKCFLDTSGDALTQGVRSSPYGIKLNADEFETLGGDASSLPAEIIRSVRRILHDCQIRYGCLTLGAKGAYVIGTNQAFFAPPPVVEVRGIQGAGDSFLAGVVAAMEEKRDMRDMLRYGMAAASGSVEKSGTHLCDADSFHRFLPMINCLPMG